MLRTRRPAVLAALFLAATLVGCGSHRTAVRSCVERWNESFAKRHLLVDLPSETEANVRMVAGRCVVTLMGPRPRALTFDSGHPEGFGGFLFAGSLDRADLPADQRRPNAKVVDRTFKLELER